MDIISTFGIAVALAMDAFSVAIASGLYIYKPYHRYYFRIAFHFGLFQFAMPIIGYFGGIAIEPIIKNFDHWIAFGLLTFIGIRMIKASFSHHETSFKDDPSKGFTLVLLALATSIDALAVGLSFGLLQKPIILPSIIIGITCSLFSMLGVFLGRKASNIIGKRAELVGGCILILIGLRILISHLQ
ncbi:MAG: manganese efflux pump MntP family protein [Spirochaetes bacterium]|nr:manganese efflux pump MntP family protein [Spirochaetota bacterium]